MKISGMFLSLSLLLSTSCFAATSFQVTVSPNIDNKYSNLQLKTINWHFFADVTPGTTFSVKYDDVRNHCVTAGRDTSVCDLIIYGDYNGTMGIYGMIQIKKEKGYVSDAGKFPGPYSLHPVKQGQDAVQVNP